jgi:hypothetical protein
VAAYLIVIRQKPARDADSCAKYQKRARGNPHLATAKQRTR